MNCKKDLKGTMILKLDIQKAYDSLDWDFLDSTLKDFGHSMSIVNLAMYSIKESEISIMWNWEKQTTIRPGWGLRQEDPLALYLFI